MILTVLVIGLLTCLWWVGELVTGAVCDIIMFGLWCLSTETSLPFTFGVGASGTCVVLYGY